MQMAGAIWIRLLPVVLAGVLAMAYIIWIERADAYVWRNLAPMLAVVFLAAFTLLRGNGSWTGSGWRLPLGTLGFALPTIGSDTF